MAVSRSALPLRERRAARAILLDPTDRVLLLRGRDPGRTDGPAWWFTPGGGIRAHEDPLAALRRECWEELGFVPEEILGPIEHRRYAFEFDRHWLVQETDYYWAPVPAFSPVPQQWSDLERRFILGWRWWPADSLAASAETIYPEDLPAMIVAAKARFRLR